MKNFQPQFFIWDQFCEVFVTSFFFFPQRKHHRARGGEPGTPKSNLEHYIFGEEIGRTTQDASKHGEAHACVGCRTSSSSVLEVERLTAENSSLQGTIHSLQDDSNLTKGVLKSQLQKLQDKLSISSAQFQEVIPAIITELVHSFIIQVFYLSSAGLLRCKYLLAGYLDFWILLWLFVKQQLPAMAIEWNLVIKQLTAKNVESDEIHKENRTLTIEKNDLHSFARLLSRGEAWVTQGLERYRLAIQILTLNLELAEENLVLTRGELKNFQSKLGCVDVMLLRL